MNTMAIPRWASWRISAPRSSAPLGVSMEVDSSSTRTRLPRSRARTISTCCCSPSDSAPVTASGSIDRLRAAFMSRTCADRAARSGERHHGAAKGQVLGHGQARHQHHMLEHSADAERQRLPGRTDPLRAAIDQDLAAVRLLQAGQHADQRRFAGAIFPEQDVDFAGPDREIDRVIGQHAGKALGDAGHLDDGGRCSLNQRMLPSIRPGGKNPSSAIASLRHLLPQGEKGANLAEQGVTFSPCGRRCPGLDPGRMRGRRSTTLALRSAGPPIWQPRLRSPAHARRQHRSAARP